MMHIDKDIKPKVKLFFEKESHSMVDTLGIEFTSLKKDEIKATMPVDRNTVQPFGILHGGASVALAETLASLGAWLNVDVGKKTSVGVEINANHIRAMRKGTSVAGVAYPISKGRKIHVWETKIYSPDEKLVCISRCTLAIINQR